jgi:hypothetical protein
MENKELVKAIYKGKTKDEKNVDLILLHFSEEREGGKPWLFYTPEKNCPNFELQEEKLYGVEIMRNIRDPRKSIWDCFKFNRCVISQIKN